MAPVLITTILTVRPGHEEELIGQWRQIADWIVTALPGTHPPSLNRDQDDRSRFVAIQEWDSVESLLQCRHHPQFQRRLGALLAGPAAKVEEVTLEPISPTTGPETARQGRDNGVSSYRGPLFSPWAVALPQTVAEARSLGERAREDMQTPRSLESFLQHLVGVWVLCKADFAHERPQVKNAFGEVGFVIDPDGRWAALLETADELHRSTGWGTEGSWEVLDISGVNNPAFQLVLGVDGGWGGALTNCRPTFATSLPLMRLGPRVGHPEFVRLDQPIAEVPAKFAGASAVNVETARVGPSVSPTPGPEPPQRAPEAEGAQPSRRRVNSYRGPLSSPWASPLPKTVAEARRLGGVPRIGMEKPLSLDAFLQYLVGVWVLCTPDAMRDSPWARDPLGEVGLVIDRDGRWAAFIEVDGELHRSIGWGTEGTWAVGDNSHFTRRPGSFEFSLGIDGAGGLPFGAPTFATFPPLMRLHGPSPQAALRQDERGTGLDYVKLDRSMPAETGKSASK